MPCAISVGAASVADRLHLSFRYRHPALDRAGAQRFTALFAAQLGLVVGT
jgi:hypothetical protein